MLVTPLSERPKSASRTGLMANLVNNRGNVTPRAVFSPAMKRQTPAPGRTSLSERKEGDFSMASPSFQRPGSREFATPTLTMKHLSRTSSKKRASGSAGDADESSLGAPQIIHLPSPLVDRSSSGRLASEKSWNVVVPDTSESKAESENQRAGNKQSTSSSVGSKRKRHTRASKRQAVSDATAAAPSSPSDKSPVARRSRRTRKA